ncbi:B-cell receptor CD22-like isoform X1 [Cyprinus carpio]|uniref:B-cell receptor CD22-like isoform X1 n=1 Tax=Cyprinus carpio TaxID=7962 RepID=A0A9Q9Y068_CYPCA|nr:B-cell receptor CD22-like isoform X1 [Cyprinus carpio]
MITATEEEGGRKVTKLKLKVTWKDDNRTLSCRPANSEDSCQMRNFTLSVEYAPKETKATVSSEDVKEGDSVTLSCSSAGGPDVSFTWFKKEKTEKAQQMSNLTLISVKPEDSGEYYCEAKNKHGAKESNIIKIDVKYGPQGVTVQSLVNLGDLKEGDKLTLKCSVQKSNPTVDQFTWYKNSQVQSETSETFIIRNVTAEDKGSYHCQADNGINTAKSDNLSVSVKYSPRNINIEGVTSVKVGPPLTLTCSADANPLPHMYTWKHKPALTSVPLPIKTGQLNIENVTIQHAGQYTCDVTNTIGTRSNTIKVDVLYPPFNLSLIMKEEVREFEVMSIICTVQSFPHSHLTVTGPQGDLRYIQNNRRNSTASANTLTVFMNVSESDAGMYTCKAKNSEGHSETIQEVIVLHAPKNVSVSSKGEQRFGSELTLTCNAHSKPAPSSYEWKKRFNGAINTVGHKQELQFNSLEITDSGLYICIAHNSIGITESPSVEIKVKYAPNINIVHNMTTSTQWNWEIPVHLTCSADAYPPATDYKWYREDNTTVLSYQQNFTVWPENPGMYYCTADNVIGKSRSKSIMLFIGNPPFNLSLIMKKEVREFEVISIICTVQSFPHSHLTVTGPQGDLRYIQNNQRNNTASANMLTVFMNVSESDAGMYTCRAEHSEGDPEIIQELIVLYAPKNVSVSSKGEQRFGSELTLTCNAHSKPAPSSYEWKKHFNGTINTVGHKQELQFNSLEITDSGLYICIAHNSIGITESPSVEIKVKYAPNINIVHNMTTSTQWNWEIPVHLTCSADAYPPATDYKWYREENNTTVLSYQQNFIVWPENPGMYYCTADNAIGKSRSKSIMLFMSSNSLTVFYKIILPIILLLILIVVAVFLIHRTIIKARSDQQSGADNPLCFFPVFPSRSSTVTNLLLLGSNNNTQENLSVESIPDPGYGRVDQSRQTPHSQDPTQARDLNPRPKSNIHTVYAAIKLPQMKQGRQSPKQQKAGYMDNDAATSTLNYVTLDFNGQNEPEKRVPEDSSVYATVSKIKQTTNSQTENPDYENVSSACVPKLPFTNMNWESDTSEEDEVNYSTVSYSAKPAAKQPKHNQKSRLSSSSSDEEDRTVYSAIKA